jgi:hypothetical protein
MAIKTIDTDDVGVAQMEPKSLDEIRAHASTGIEVEGNLGDDEFALEAFMNELVKVRIHGSPEEGALPVISVIVNGVIQPVPRDVEVDVKRKYVEALARAKATSYRQVTNPIDPSDIKMVPTTVLSYPFTVTEDSAKGKAWLRKILAQPA